MTSRVVWSATADGLTWGDGHSEPVFKPWGSLQKLCAYKTDDFTVDTVWLQLDFGSGDEVRIAEADFALFEHLCRFVEAEFTLDPDWFWQIVQPPFEENFTVLFERPSGKSGITRKLL